MNRRERVTTGAALCALAAGLLVYGVARDPAGLAWLPAALSPAWPTAVVPAAWTGPLPSFLHTLGFILLTAVAAGLHRRASLAVVSLAWVGVEWLFEFGQHPALAGDLAAGLSGLPGLELAGAYFVRGTFDPLDLLAVVLAGGLAWALGCGPPPEENPHV